MPEKITGRLKWFDKVKGYGFIESNGQDYFVHNSSFQNDEEFLEGDMCAFEIKQTDKGFSAINVIKIKE